MEKKTSPGIVLATKFVKSDSKVFQNYVDYIDRDEAVRNDKFKELTAFKEYVGEYMDNREKTYGLFTADKDALSDTAKENLKNLYQEGQKNGSLMWQTVISFDNDFLKKNGLYGSELMDIDETKLREYTRMAMQVLLKKENMEDALWSASIHKNTDNIHVHIATIEVNPSWMAGKGRCRSDKSGSLYQRGKFKQGSIDAAKSSFANGIIKDQVDNQKINQIMRQNILMQSRDIALISANKEISSLFVQLTDSLPDDLRLLKYGNNAMKAYRPAIDQISDKMIDSFFSEEYSQLKGLLYEADQVYEGVYGKSETRKFSKDHLEDLKGRLGNVVLQQAAEYKRERRHENGSAGLKRRATHGSMAAGKNESKAAWEEREQLHHVNQMKRGFRKAFKHQAEAARNIAIYEHLVIENVER